MLQLLDLNGWCYVCHRLIQRSRRDGVRKRPWSLFWMQLHQVNILTAVGLTNNCISALNMTLFCSDWTQPQGRGSYYNQLCCEPWTQIPAGPVLRQLQTCPVQCRFQVSLIPNSSSMRSKYASFLLLSHMSDVGIERMVERVWVCKGIPRTRRMMIPSTLWQT